MKDVKVSRCFFPTFAQVIRWYRCHNLPQTYGSPGGPHSDFVFIFRFSLFIFYISVLIFYFSVFVFNVLIFTSLFCFSVSVSVLVFILSFSDFAFNFLIFTSSFCILWPFWASVVSLGGPHSEFVFIFHFSVFIFYVSVFVFYFSVFVLNVLIFTSSFCFSVLVLVFILSFSVFVINVLIFTSSFCFMFHNVDRPYTTPFGQVVLYLWPLSFIVSVVQNVNRLL